MPSGFEEGLYYLKLKAQRGFDVCRLSAPAQQLLRWVLGGWEVADHSTDHLRTLVQLKIPPLVTLSFLKQYIVFLCYRLYFLLSNTRQIAIRTTANF